MTVLPAINVEEGDDAGLRARLDAVRGAAGRVHLDVCDGTMTPNRTWRDAARWREFAGGLGLQVHLMTDEPEAVLMDWLDAGAQEVVVHVEPLVFPKDENAEPVAIRLQRLRAVCQARGAALLVAGLYETPSRPLLAARAYADAFLVLAVPPGRAGQGMQEEALGLARDVRAAFPDVPVWFDGGVSAEALPAIRDAGATGAVAAHAVFGAEDPAAALAALQLI